MPAYYYEFFTRWRLAATIEEVAVILADIESLPRWWPSVYLNCTVLEPGDGTGVGRTFYLKTRGWLPYTLQWNCTVTHLQPPEIFDIEATGDLEGSGRWSLKQDGELADIRFAWKVLAEKPLLRALSFLLKPVFEANHRWAMKQGERSLRLELLRRRSMQTGTPPPNSAPPPPALYSGWLLAGAAVVLCAALTRALGAGDDNE